MKVEILEDVVIADQHPWISHWNLKKGETRNVPENVADRLIARNQGKLTAEEAAKKGEPKAPRKSRRSSVKKDA